MNAVFERDFVRFSCSARFLWIRAGFALSMGALVLSRILPGYLNGSHADVGIDVLRLATILGAATVLLMAPGAFGTVLVHARAQGSLPVLLSTPLTPLKIAVGAFAARCGLLVLFVIATWPPIALALLFGGVRSEQLFEASATMLAATLVIGGPAFLVSAFARRTAGAVVASYLLAAGILAALAVVGTQLTTNDPWLAAAISPLEALTQALDPAPKPPAYANSIPPSYVCLLWTLFLAVGSILFAAYRLREEGLGDGDATVPSRLLPRKFRPLRYSNPILDHELRTGMLGNSQSGSRSLFALLVLTELAYFGAVHMGQDETSLSLHFGVLAFECLLLVLGVTAAGATTLATEHETHVLDLMRVTPLTPAQIVIGKLAGLMRTLFPCLVVPLFHLLWASLALDIFSPLAVVLFPVAATAAMCTWALAGMLQSLEQTDPRRSILRTMGLIGIFGVIIAAMIGVPVRGVMVSPPHDPWVVLGSGFGANPIGLMLLPVTAVRIAGSSGELTVEPPPGANDIMIASVSGVVWIGLHVIVAFLLYRRLFKTYRTRFDW